MTTIEELLAEERWPCVDGVYFDSGDVIVMECALELWVRPLARSKLESILELNEDMMTSLGTLFTTESGGYRLTGGEGSNGAEGFLVLSRPDSRVVWVAYFQTSNPFTGAAVESGQVVATTNLGHRWSFPIDRPELVKVDWKPGAS